MSTLEDTLIEERKKRNWCDQPNTEEDPKKQLEQNLNVSCLEKSTSVGDAFEERLKSGDCVKILMNYQKRFRERSKRTTFSCQIKPWEPY